MSVKLRLCVFFLTGMHVFCSAKKIHTASFYFVPLPDNEVPYYSWSINGKAVDEKTRCTIPIHYPYLDTIILTHENKKRIIITSLKKGHIYELGHGGWHKKIDLRDMTEHLNNRHRRQPKQGTRNLTVTFIYHHLPADTVIAGMFDGYGRILKENERMSIESIYLEDPELTSVFGDIKNIHIGHGSVRRENDIYNDFRFDRFSYDDEHSFVFDEELISFEYIFFDSSTLLVDYDHKLKKIKLRLK